MSNGNLSMSQARSTASSMKPMSPKPNATPSARPMNHGGPRVDSGGQQYSNIGNRLGSGQVSTLGGQQGGGGFNMGGMAMGSTGGGGGFSLLGLRNK